MDLLRSRDYLCFVTRDKWSLVSQIKLQESRRQSAWKLEEENEERLRHQLTAFAPRLKLISHLQPGQLASLHIHHRLTELPTT